jgi:hypothetical protein
LYQGQVKTSIKKLFRRVFKVGSVFTPLGISYPTGHIPEKRPGPYGQGIRIPCKGLDLFSHLRDIQRVNCIVDPFSERFR